jgi:hypothetical protein
MRFFASSDEAAWASSTAGRDRTNVLFFLLGPTINRSDDSEKPGNYFMAQLGVNWAWYLCAVVSLHEGIAAACCNAWIPC